MWSTRNNQGPKRLFTVVRVHLCAVGGLRIVCRRVVGRKVVFIQTVIKWSSLRGSASCIQQVWLSEMITCCYFLLGVFAWMRCSNVAWGSNCSLASTSESNLEVRKNKSRWLSFFISIGTLATDLMSTEDSCCKHFGISSSRLGHGLNQRRH